ncbi:porin [Craterilacuibacter sp. RT1T]|uniref:porin n=1 Tax=Craterilacuibacter sp. RT1T TaxID=2942211 RepID=UPI0020BF68FB|nr:porin [Craterilacuibacter sp. RT1T]MCL6261958.1 porin [Craterilacuibacter sp. RT1T]
MKKVLIAALVSALPAAAMADVTVYGIIKGGVESADNGTTTKTQIDDLGSRIGFKGAEDLGNGLKAIWQVETGVAIDNSDNSGNWANRQSFIGLTSDYGTFRLGNLSNFGDSDMGTVDPYEYGNEALGLGIFTRDNSRVKNAVRIDSPEYAGFKASFLYGTKEDKSRKYEFKTEVDGTTGYYDGVRGADTDRETYNLGLSYDYANFFGKYSYTYENALSGTVYGKDTDGVYEANVQLPHNQKHQLEVGYDANNLFVGLGYKNSKGDFSVTPLSFYADTAVATFIGDNKKFESQEYALTAAYTMGAITPKITYAQGLDIKYDGVKQNNTDYKQVVIGADYALSKRTIVGAQYGQIKFGSNAALIAGLEKGEDTINAFGVNMIHKF